MDDDDASLPASDSDTLAPDAPTAEAGGTSRFKLGQRCTHSGCTKQRVTLRGSNPFCIAHGGGVPCAAEGCAKLVSQKFCSTHGGYRCTFPGCTKNMKLRGVCRLHAEESGLLDRVRTENAALKAREKRRRARIQRDRQLRDRHLHRIFAEQRFRCRNSVVTCVIVQNGMPKYVCPWGDEQPTFYALELDHIVPLWEGGTDDPVNLQVLCSCCHAVKTALERPRLEAMRRNKREALDDPDAAQAWLDEFGEDEL